MIEVNMTEELTPAIGWDYDTSNDYDSDNDRSDDRSDSLATKEKSSTETNAPTKR
jgi:hypothetical protein